MRLRLNDVCLDGTCEERPDFLPPGEHCSAASPEYEGLHHGIVEESLLPVRLNMRDALPVQVNTQDTPLVWVNMQGTLLLQLNMQDALPIQLNMQDT